MDGKKHCKELDSDALRPIVLFRMVTTVHIRERKEGKCLAQNGEWTHQMHRARIFKSAIDAADFCHAEKLTGVELLILRPDHPPLRVPL
jgi:hypothetical protein